MKGFGAFCNICSSGVDASRCADECCGFWCACTVVFLLEDQSR